MKRIQTLTAVQNKFGAGKSGFNDGDPANGIPATDLEARWFDQAQESLLRIIEAAGETPSDDLDQFTRCVTKLIESRVGDYALDTGAVNAPVVAMNPAVTTYANGMEVSFRLKFANTGAATLNAGGGTRPLVRDDGAALVAGDLPVNVLVNAFYDLPSDKFIINSLVTSQAVNLAQFIGANQSFVANGYQKLPGGFIVQWGFVNLTASSGALTFPITFPNACLNFNSQAIEGAGAAYASPTAVPSVSGVANVQRVPACGYYWRAIGY